MLDFLKNKFLNSERYKTHSKAVIISCFFNPQNSPYRLLAFQKWYHSIKHLNHRIIECVIGNAKPQLPKSQYITQIQTENLLWHKESLLNKVIQSLPDSYEYVFWVDADVLFVNQNWLVEAVRELQTANILQPFEYCIHLEKNQLKPNFDVDANRLATNLLSQRHPNLWRSFCSNYLNGLSSDINYDRHGHVGFAWGARREVVDQCPLYDKALIGGADHIMAHAAAGQIPHPCISNTFTDNLDEVIEWSQKFYDIVQGKISFVSGDLYHIWHGDIANRKYLQRVKEFTGQTQNLKRDKNGMHVKPGKDAYMKKYYKQREITKIDEEGFGDFDDGFFEDMGYMIWDIFNLFGTPIYDDTDDAPTDVAPTDVITDNMQDVAVISESNSTNVNYNNDAQESPVSNNFS